MKRYVFGIVGTTLLITVLMISSAAQVPITTIQSSTDMIAAHVTKKAVTPHLISAQSQQKNLFDPAAALDTNKAFGGPGNQKHPALEKTESGALITGYYDEDEDDLFWTYSADNGQTFAAPTQGNVSGDYPTIKLWEGEQIYGTWVTDPLDFDGGMIYLALTDDPTNISSYNAYYWDGFYLYGWYGMIDADIACDNSGNYWEYGVTSLVISATNYTEYTNGPSCFFTDPSTPWYGWMCWLEEFDGCAHCDVDIDPVTHQVYLVYDYYNTTASEWHLIVWTYNYATRLNIPSWVFFEIDGNGNLQNPAVAAYDDTVIILAETDENTNQDILCLSTTTGIENLTATMAADSTADEQYPDVRRMNDDTFLATYIADGNLQRITTDDDGATWGGTVQVNENAGAVVAEYKTSDLCTDSLKCMWQETGDDSDIWIGTIRDQLETPTWEVGDSWTYDTHLYIAASENVTDDMVFNGSGTLTFEVVNDTGDTYILEGKMRPVSGTIEIPGRLGFRLTRLSSFTSTLEIQKTNLSLRRHDYTMKGIVLLKLGPIPLPIPIQMQTIRSTEFDPMWKILAFPVYDGKKGYYENSSMIEEYETSMFWGLIPIANGTSTEGWVGNASYDCNADTITVPAGTYDVCNVSCNVDFGTEAHDYYISNYAQEVGNIVKGIYNIDFRNGNTYFLIELELVSTTYAP
jgi:autotransporter-associated beta strand protein